MTTVLAQRAVGDQAIRMHWRRAGLRRIFVSLTWVVITLVTPAMLWAAPNNPLVPASKGALGTGTAVSAPPGAPVDEDDIAPDSPRASVEDYLRLCRQGNYREAARYLNVPAGKAKRAAELARRLHAVLDRNLSIDLESISPSSEGSLNSKLAHGYEEIGHLQTLNGKVEPLRLVQKSYPGPDARWVFSQAVVVKIDDWYGQLQERWILDRLPPYLSRRTVFNLMIWQWVALPVLLLVSWFTAYVLSLVSRRILTLLAARTKVTWDDELVTHIDGPLTLVWALILIEVAIPWLGLPVSAATYGHSLVRGCFLFSLFWVLSRLVEAWGKRLIVSQWAQDRAISSALIGLGVRVGKIAVLVAAVVVLVSAMGYPAASLIAGLGVGGLAVALAAQKTLEHMFGAFAIGADQPFREGDFIKVEDVLGTVESIGLRSTRIRTLDRTVVTIPNGKLSEMRVESYSARDKIRLACNIGLVYETSAQQLQDVISGVEGILNTHPKIAPDKIIVRLSEFAASSLKIEVMAWFLTTDWNEFLEIRQGVLLQFIECVRHCGTSFAFSTQTLHLDVSTMDPRFGSEKH